MRKITLQIIFTMSTACMKSHEKYLAVLFAEMGSSKTEKTAIAASQFALAAILAENRCQRNVQMVNAAIWKRAN